MGLREDAVKRLLKALETMSTTGILHLVYFIEESKKMTVNK